MYSICENRKCSTLIGKEEILMKKKLSILLASAVAAAACVAGLSACKTKYDLVYASWNLGTEAGNNIERQMIKAFEEKFDVKVKIEENISLSAYDQSINALAVRDSMPDVFMLSNINFGLSERYVSDITDLVNADASGDWNKIPKPIEEAVHFKSGIYAIPFAMHMMGYFVNVDLLQQYGLESFAEQEITYDSFLNVVREMSTKKGDGEGYIGLSHENTIFEWYPASVNSEYGWYTWDGEEYHLDSPEFAKGMELTLDMRQNKYTYDSLTEEDREQYFPSVDGYIDLWNQSRLAIRWGYSYEVPDMIKNCSFNIKFMGVPGGRTPMVGDYLAISNTCKDRELAYKFAKWMSFDPAGIRERIKLDKDVTNTMPLTTDRTLINEYFDKFDAVDGLKDAFDTLDNGIVESVKVVPGYTRSRWTSTVGVSLPVEGGANANVGQLIDWCWTGKLSFADYAAKLNEKANDNYLKTIDEYEAFYN